MDTFALAGMAHGIAPMQTAPTLTPEGPPPVPSHLRGAAITPVPLRGLGIRRTDRLDPAVYTMPRPEPLVEDWFFADDEASLDRIVVPDGDDDVEITWRRGVSPWAVLICAMVPVAAAVALVAWALA